MQAMFAGMLKSSADIAVLVIDFPRTDRCTYDSWLVAIDAFKAAGEDWSGQLAVLASLPENLPESIAFQLMSDGIVPFAGLEDALLAIASAQSPPCTEYTEVYLPTTAFDSDALEILAVGESKAKHWLSAQGVLTPESRTLNVANKRDSVLDAYLVAQCGSMRWPLVVKSTASLHKSDQGGVLLGIESQSQLRSAITKVGVNGSCLVEEQIEGSVVELLVGVVRDPVHGFLMTIGAGGVQTEILRDTASALLPVSKDALAELLASLRCYPLLQGYRGQEGCNIEKLIDSLTQIQKAVFTIADDLVELEINPLICTQHSAIAADAILRVVSTSQLLVDK